MFKHNVIICIFGMQGVKADIDIFNDMKMLQMNEVAVWDIITSMLMTIFGDNFDTKYCHQYEVVNWTIKHF